MTTPKQIRINGVLYEAVENSHNSQRNLREFYGHEIEGTVTLPYGPSYVWNNDMYAVYLATDEDSPENPLIWIMYTDDPQEKRDAYVSTQAYEPIYSADEKGYKQAKKDFQDICRMLDHGKTIYDAAAKYQYALI